MKAMWQDPEYREKILRAMNDPTVVEKRKKSVAAYWSDPTHREEHGKIMSETWGEQRRREHGEKMKKRWEDPEYREKCTASFKAVREQVRESLKRYWANPENRARASEAARKRMEDPGLRRRISESVKALQDDPEYVARQRANPGSLPLNTGQIPRQGSGTLRGSRLVGKMKSGGGHLLSAIGRCARTRNTARS